MVNIVHIVALGLILGEVPLGWYEGVDGSFNDIQSGALDKNTPMLSVSLEKPKHPPTSTVQIRVKLYNNTETTIQDPEWGCMAQVFDFEVKDPDGVVLKPNQLFKRRKDIHEITFNISRPMKPGDFGYFIINLSLYYDFKPGQNYTVRLWKYVVLNYKGHEGDKVASSVLSFVAPQ